MTGMEVALAVGAVASLAGTAMSAQASQAAAKEQARAAEFERGQLKIQEETARTAAAQAEARRREELTANLMTINAMRAGRGVGSDSPTGLAILETYQESEERDMRNERLTYLMRSDSARMGAEMARNKAKTSLLAGNMNAGADILGGVARTAGMFRK